MKKAKSIIIALLALTMLLTGCKDENKKVEVDESTNVDVSIENSVAENTDNEDNTEDFVNEMSFEERIDEYTKFISEGSKELDNYVGKTNWISRVYMEKEKDHYKLKADIANPITIKAEELSSVIELSRAENKESVNYKEYKIFLSVDDLLKAFESTNYVELINGEVGLNNNSFVNEKNIPILMTDSNEILDFKALYRLVPSSESEGEYYVAEMNYAGASGFYVSECTKTIAIDLLKDDLIRIRDDVYDGAPIMATVTAEEYYNYSMDNRIEKDYKYDINDMSGCRDGEDGLIDGLKIENEKIYINK